MVTFYLLACLGSNDENGERFCGETSYCVAEIMDGGEVKRSLRRELKKRKKILIKMTRGMTGVEFASVNAPSFYLPLVVDQTSENHNGSFEVDSNTNLVARTIFSILE